MSEPTPVYHVVDDPTKAVIMIPWGALTVRQRNTLVAALVAMGHESEVSAAAEIEEMTRGLLAQVPFKKLAKLMAVGADLWKEIGE